MPTPPTPLDRVTLGQHPVAPRSSLLHVGSGDAPGLADAEWWVSIASRHLPEHLTAAHPPLDFGAWTASGGRLFGSVAIVGRQDDAWGTRLLLRGVGEWRSDTMPPRVHGPHQVG